MISRETGSVIHSVVLCGGVHAALGDNTCRHVQHQHVTSHSRGLALHMSQVYLVIYVMVYLVTYVMVYLVIYVMVDLVCRILNQWFI